MGFFPKGMLRDEYLIPLRKDQVGCNYDTAAFVAFCEEGEEHFHLVSGLLDIANVIQDQNFKAIEDAQLVCVGRVLLANRLDALSAWRH